MTKERIVVILNLLIATLNLLIVILNFCIVILNFPIVILNLFQDNERLTCKTSNLACTSSPAENVATSISG
jgi:hypothetical protein